MTDTGRVRQNNEDSHGQRELADGTGLLVVCDGMGGHESGEVASRLAVRVLLDRVGRTLPADIRRRMFEALLEANEVVIAEGRRTGARGMGTTAVAAMLGPKSVHISHVGDSRAYLVRRGHVRWRSHDHTRVMALIDAGELSEERARSHPYAGMLTRALGHARMSDGRPFVPEVLDTPLELEGGDVLVLCSDGLHDLVDDPEIAAMTCGRDAEDIATRLVALANERGGHDNVTVSVAVRGHVGAAAGDLEGHGILPAGHEQADIAEPTFDGGIAANDDAYEPVAHQAPLPLARKPFQPQSVVEVAVIPDVPVSRVSRGVDSAIAFVGGLAFLAALAVLLSWAFLQGSG